MEDIAAHPGGELIAKGLADILAGETDTIESLLVMIGAERLRRAGIDVPAVDRPSPEHALYAALADSPNAHSRYNALLRRLVSFEHSVECARR